MTELPESNDEPNIHVYEGPYKKLFSDLSKFIIDPRNTYYSVTKEQIITQLENIMKEDKIAAIESDVTKFKHGGKFDEVLEYFMAGTNGHISKWSIEENTTLPLVIRGVGGSSRNAIKHCWETNRTFYAIDTGYFGNNTKVKVYHRATKNNLQNIGPIIERPWDRVSPTNWKFMKFHPGRKILICPPSDKIMMLYGMDLDEWLNTTVETIKKHTDRPIEIRLKPIRKERISNKTIADALADDVHCLVTYNSIAATEALMLGKPAFTMGLNAAHSLCLHDLSKIETPYIPSRDELEALVAHLSYCQFTLDEFKSGYAWGVVNEGR